MAGASTLAAAVEVQGVAVHIIPVPDGMTPEEAWAEIQVFGHLWSGTVSEDGQGGHWAAITVDE